jgi:hypothetical protein
MKKVICIFVCMLVIGTTSIAVADWSEGDGYKMHFPQLPDPVGWDVSFHDWQLGDDWKCSETGPVKDIHFWISWRHDIVGDLPFIGVAIYSNDPTPPSKPAQQLWGRTFTPDQFVTKGPMTGDQGWLEPNAEYFLHDHMMYYQINIKNISEPFVQQNGIIYWLVIQMPFLYPIEIGWKTSMNHFEDAAVWGNPGQWNPIIDPITQLPIDFSFVINGEVPKPDLSCRGSISWQKTTGTKQLATRTGTFEVGNVGQPGSLLNWQVTDWPTWGTWSFSPSSGTGLADGSWVTVTATCVPPNQPNQQFTGNITITNTDDATDFCKIPVTLKTVKSRVINAPFLQFLEKLILQLPMLKWVLSLH